MIANPKTSKQRAPKSDTRCAKRRIRRIVQSGGDRQINHRADYMYCPSCDHAMQNEKWNKAGVTLVLEPGIYKAGCVTVVSECPKCFELSWIHERMSSFEWNDAWPADWKEAVKRREASVKLEAMRQWGAGICHSCRNLTKGEVEYCAWRHCVKGIGEPQKSCDKYTALNSPNT